MDSYSNADNHTFAFVLLLTLPILIQPMDWLLEQTILKLQFWIPDNLNMDMKHWQLSSHYFVPTTSNKYTALLVLG